MHFKKIISIWALLALMFGQVILAQHSASHIDHQFYQEVIAFHGGYDKHQHDQDNKKHECPECLLTKSLQAAFYNDPIVLSFALQGKDLTPTQKLLTVNAKRHKAHSPRAPPAILI